MLAASVAAAGEVPGKKSTPIARLNRLLQATAARRHETDLAIGRMAGGPDKRAMEVAFDALLYECLAIQRRITGLQAQTLEDVAVQATIAFYIAGQGDLDDDDAEDLCRVQASIVLAVVQIAGLDIDRLGWGDMRGLCAIRAPLGGGLGMSAASRRGLIGLLTAGAAAPAMAAVAGGGADADADAEILALRDIHRTNNAAIRRLNGTDAADDAYVHLDECRWASIDRAAELVATTVAGLRAKAARVLEEYGPAGPG